MSLDEHQQDQLVNLLKELEPGYLPYDIFVEFARLNTLSIIEFVPLRINDTGEVEVLLLSRGHEDKIWPNQLHTPGTVIRPTDTEGEMYVAFERIFKDELLGTKLSPPHYVGSLLHKSRRGTEHAQIYWVEILEPPRTGEFYPINKLPASLIESQEKFINLASKNFQSSRI